ncbi:urease accessory protein UreD [Dactylosporangium sp. CA-139066]|uniref:urease accessory protein UreD n=1 Tax=Dactylosporangium sp. CA-139066 TaxID=3239930 RepID=UPI003D8EC240
MTAVLHGYDDEPAQRPAGSVGKHGVLRLRLARRGGRTELVELYRQAPLVVQQALHYDEAAPGCACIVVVDTAGGVVQGDRYEIDARLDEHAHAYVTTQSATRVQQMDANHATQANRFVLADGAYLEYLPEPIIPYRTSRFATHTDVVLPSSATALVTEIVLPGRRYHHPGERFGYELLSLSSRVARPDGTEVFAERYRIEPARRDPSAPARLGGYPVFATALVLTPPPVAERVLAGLPQGTDPSGWSAGATRLPNEAGLAYKVLSHETAPARALIRACWDATRRAVIDRPAPPPFAWR